MTLQQALLKIEVLEEELLAWKRLYVRAIRHDDRIIQQVQQEVGHERR